MFCRKVIKKSVHASNAHVVILAAVIDHIYYPVGLISSGIHIKRIVQAILEDNLILHYFTDENT